MGPVSRQNNFDLLRIFAAMQVVLIHSVAHLHLPITPAALALVNAFPGVPIFFVVSGFLISSAFERSPSLLDYARNRALRIFPALWCCVVITALVAALFGFSLLNAQAAAWLPAQFIGLIYTPQFLSSFGFGSYNGALWTIPIELQFYVLLPAVYLLAGLRHREGAGPWLPLLWAAFTAIALASADFIRIPAADVVEATSAKLYRYSFIPHFYMFLAGVLMNRLGLGGSALLRGRGLYWLAAYLLVYYLVPYSTARQVAGMLLLGVTTVSLAYTAPATARRLLHGHDISYGVYIYHGLLLNIFVQLGCLGRWTYFGGVVAGTLLAATASWLLVERPMLRRKHHSPAAATPAVATAESSS